MAKWGHVVGGVCDLVVEAASVPQVAFRGGAWVAITGDAGPGWHWSGTAWSAAPVVPAVPQVVTMRQARLALLGAGLLDDVEAAIDAIADGTERAAARITWDHSQEVQRTNGLVSQLAPALGLTAEQIDALFVAAAAL